MHSQHGLGVVKGHDVPQRRVKIASAKSPLPRSPARSSDCRRLDEHWSMEEGKHDADYDRRWRRTRRSTGERINARPMCLGGRMMVE